jgi:hypothetical protein
MSGFVVYTRKYMQFCYVTHIIINALKALGYVARDVMILRA